MYRLLRQCRACGYGTPPTPSGVKSERSNEKLIPAFSLGLQPLANDFCGDDDERGGYAPLQVLLCPRCTLAQLSVTVRPDILYSKYAYVTSASATMQRHLERLYADIIQRQSTIERVLEIGSNDGRYLDWISKQGPQKVCGIDPAENLHPNTVESICDVFCYGSAELARLKLGAPADVVIARHVFCHVDDWVGFMRNLEQVTHSESLVVIEVPYVGNLLAKTEWDTIYHEHTSYLSFKAMMALLERVNFRLHDILEYDIHGGVVALFLRHKDSSVKPNADALARAANEVITEDHWHAFSVRAHNLINEIHDLAKGLAHGGKTVCVYGAAAKATVLINACRLTRKEIVFVADSTKWKWFKTIPGTDIPVLDEGALLREMPDYALLGAWNFAAEIMQKNELWTSKGGRWIIPIPEVKIVP